jgi:hypothetical protein
MVSPRHALARALRTYPACVRNLPVVEGDVVEIEFRGETPHGLAVSLFIVASE